MNIISRRRILKGGLVTALATITGCNFDKPNKIYFTWDELHKDTNLMPLRLIDIPDILKLIKYDKLEFPELWKSAKRTLEEGIGDCDDTSILGSYLAWEFLEYEPKLLAVADDKWKNSHAMSLLRAKVDPGEPEEYGAIDKGQLFFPVHESVSELIHSINDFVSARAQYFEEQEKTKQPRIIPFTQYRVIDLRKCEKAGYDWVKGKENLFRYFKNEFAGDFNRLEPRRQYSKDHNNS